MLVPDLQTFHWEHTYVKFELKPFRAAEYDELNVIAAPKLSVIQLNLETKINV